MKHLEIYFDKNGISSSQANHVANLIKEKNKVVDSELNNTAAYKEVLRREGENFTLKNPQPVDLFNLSRREGELYALSSWLREAIKARETLLTFYRECPHTFFGEVPVWNPPPSPVKKQIPVPAKATEADIFETFSLKELAEYWALESKAAHIGKRIHKGGTVSNIREEILANKDSVTTFTVMDGKHYPVSFEKVYSIDDVSDAFDKLQKLHRGYEQKLNFYKAKIQNGMTELNAKRLSEYRKDQEAENARYNKEWTDCNDALREQQEKVALKTAENEQSRALKLREVSSWKIVIPYDLSEIYQQFSE